MALNKKRKKNLNVAIAGLGNVGGEAARLMTAHTANYSAQTGAFLRLRAVWSHRVSAKARSLGLPASVQRIKNMDSLLKDSSIDIIVELLGGVKDARRLVLGALAAGKHVVTANKHLLSKHWKEIHFAALRARRRVYFEGAVAGGIPIISALREGLAANKISSVYGIFNGTTNYILSTMAHSGCSMQSALKEAQRLKMAEKDPTLDLNGSDTMHKVSILASMVTGSWVRPEKISRIGIEHFEAEDMRYAVDRLGHTVRLIGTVGIDWKSPNRPRVEAHVQPTLIGFKHPLAAVHGGYNAVLVNTSCAGDLMFYGQGAGPGPAASAVLSDILSLSKEIVLGTQSPTRSKTFPFASNAPECDAPFYLKFKVRDVPGALSKITGVLGKNRISIAEIHQPGGRASTVPVMITTHATSRRCIDAARKAITRLSMVSPKHTCLRFLPL